MSRSGRAHAPAATPDVIAVTPRPAVGGTRGKVQRAGTWVADHELRLLAPFAGVLVLSNTLPLRIRATSLALVLVVWLCSWISRGIFARRTPVDFPILILVGMGLIGLFASADFVTSLRVNRKMVSEVAIFYGLVDGVNSRPKLWLIPRGLLGFFVAGQNLGIESIMNSLLSTQSVGTVQSRMEVWQRAVYMIQRFPFAGVGPGTFPLVVQALYPFFLMGLGNSVPHAHNIYLLAGVDLGIPGLVAFIALLGAILLLALENIGMAKRAEWGPLAVGLLCGFIVY